MRRGDLVSVAIPGDFGKPRPALILQSDRLLDLDTVVVALLTSEILPAAYLRLTIEPDDTNGLRKMSQVMVDKIMTLKREKSGPVFGHLTDGQMTEVQQRLGLLFDFA